MKRLAYFACVCTLICGSASAGFIQADTAVASTEFSGHFRATNTIDGSGLSSLSATATHATYVRGNHWTTAANDTGNVLNAWIEWGFNTAQNLDKIHIWNHRSNNIAANDGYEPILFDLLVKDASNNVLLSWDNVALAPDTNLAQTFNFGSTLVGVKSVRFDVEQIQSTGDRRYTGLAEVGFNSGMNAVPEPATLAMWGLAGGIGLVIARRRRKGITA